jgi:hypothetical protein
MLRRIIEMIDSLSENINPLVLRDLRRASRNFIYPGILCLYFVSIIFIVFLFWNDREFIDASSMFAAVICIGGIFAGLLAVSDTATVFVTDELFLMNGLSPRQYLHAYITISAVNSLFVISLSLPPLTVVQIAGGQGLNLPFLYIIPILAFLLGQTFNLLILSFMAHAKSPGIKRFPTIREQIAEFFFTVSVGLLFWLPCITWFLAGFLWKEVFKLPPPTFNNRFDLISIYFLFPIMLLIISATAYKLCLYGFKINFKSKLSGCLYNIFIYTILSTFLTVIYFTLMFLFG